MTTPNKRHVEILAEVKGKPIELDHVVTCRQALTALATLQGECDESCRSNKIELSNTITEWVKKCEEHKATIASLKEENRNLRNALNTSEKVCAFEELQETIASLREEVERLKKGARISLEAIGELREEVEKLKEQLENEIQQKEDFHNRLLQSGYKFY